MIQKSDWLIYGELVRKQLGEMQDTKSGKRGELRVRTTYLVACETKGYRGSLKDWEYLLGRRARR